MSGQIYLNASTKANLAESVGPNASILTILAATLATIHNERFIVRLVDQMRQALLDGNFADMKADFLGRFKHRSGQAND